MRLPACSHPFQMNVGSVQAECTPCPIGEEPWAGAALGAVGGCISLPLLSARPTSPAPGAQSPRAPGPRRTPEGPPSPEASRSPAHGAYLQSLEPSSRRWVLGGAKPPEEATLGPGAPGSGEPAGEIWYNPIPEEDPRLPAPELPGPQPGSAEADSPASPGEHKPPTLGPAR